MPWTFSHPAAVLPFARWAPISWFRKQPRVHVEREDRPDVIVLLYSAVYAVVVRAR